MQVVSRGETETRSVRSFCRICTAICGIVVDVAGDEVVRVRGDDEHPLSHGYTCAKGRALPKVHHHPDRIERPMMRVDGALQASTWDACLDDLGDRLRSIIAEHGPEAVGIYFGSGLGMDAAGYKMMESLFHAIGTPAKFSPLTIDGTAKTLVSHLVGGFPGFTSHIDYDRARLVLYIGVNPVVSHGHNIALSDPVSSIRALRAHADVWVLDPRRTETARRLATRHLAPRPGTDYAVLAFLVRELLRDGADRDVLEHRTIGLEELTAAVEPFALDHAAAIAGLHARRSLGAAHGCARRGAGRDPHRHRRHDGGGRRQRDGVARVGADDHHRRDEPTGWRVVPSGVQPPVRFLRTAGARARDHLWAGPTVTSGHAGVSRRVAVRRVGR